jgi:hypothetical protein
MTTTTTTMMIELPMRRRFMPQRPMFHFRRFMPCRLKAGWSMDLPEGGASYFDSWGRISEAHHYVAPPPYTEAELMQLSQGGVPLSGGPNYMDVSMVHMAICDIGLQMCTESLYNHEHVIL